MSYDSDVFKFNSGLRYLDKNLNNCERLVHENWWIEQIKQYGVSTQYYVNSYSLSGHDFLYGEQPTQKFEDPKTVVLSLTLSENAVTLSKFGLIADDEVTAVVSISGFQTVFGENSEPKSGDVFDLEELGRNSRLNSRAGKKFQITERLDQDVSQINSLMGHYVWLIKAKRFDYSFEPGVEREPVMDQVYDDTFSGRLAGGTNNQTDTKTYSDNADTSSEQDVFDYSSYGNNDDVYGDYM